METATKVKTYNREQYIEDIIKISSVNFSNSSAGICQEVDHKRFPMARAQLIRDKKLTPETGTKWLREHLQETAEVIEGLPEDIFFEVWDCKKDMLSHFEAVIWPEDPDLVDQKEFHIYDALNKFEEQYNKK